MLVNVVAAVAADTGLHAPLHGVHFHSRVEDELHDLLKRLECGFPFSQDVVLVAVRSIRGGELWRLWARWRLVAL